MKKDLSKFIMVRISEEQSEKLENLSNQYNLNKSNIVRLLINHFLNGEIELVLKKMKGSIN